MQKLEDHGDVGVFLGDGDEVQIVVLDEGESDGSVLDNWRHIAFLLTVHDQRHKLLDDSHVQVASVVS